VPERRYPFHRYAWISNYGEDMPPGRSALVAEVTVPPGREVDLEGLKQEVVQGLAELGELREEDVGVAAAWFHGYGYPVYTLTHSSDVSMLERCLRELGVAPFGRWGAGSTGTPPPLRGSAEVNVIDGIERAGHSTERVCLCTLRSNGTVVLFLFLYRL
jgi:protoporphyrinogen oxidase